jgi:pilus assembly protein CpaF
LGVERTLFYFVCVGAVGASWDAELPKPSARSLQVDIVGSRTMVRPRGFAVGSQTSTFKRVRQGANVSFDELLKDALRFRSDRIILGEVRGLEARTLLDSFNPRHAGSLATIHANSAEKALRRFANLVMRSHAQTTFSETEAEIGEAVDFVVHLERQPGRRILREVLAPGGYDRDAKRFLIEPVFEVKHAAA